MCQRQPAEGKESEEERDADERRTRESGKKGSVLKHDGNGEGLKKEDADEVRLMVTSA